MTPEQQAAADEAARIETARVAEAARVAEEANKNKTPEEIAADAEKARQTNAENAQRRRLETAEARVKELEKVEKDRADAELTEVERLKKEAAEAKQGLEATTLEIQRLKAGQGLPEEALKFLTGTDEATLTQQAADLKALFAPGAAGTITRPGHGQGPTLDEKITEAEKKGQGLQSIRFKMDKLAAS